MLWPVRMRPYLVMAGSVAATTGWVVVARFSCGVMRTSILRGTMTEDSPSSSQPLPPSVRVHVVGAGPVGLLMAALLQPSPRFSVHLYEKRREYTRTRMVKLAPYLIADSVASYCTDYIDEENVQALFDTPEIEEGIAFRQSLPDDLMTLVRGWTEGFCPLNAIEHALDDLIQTRERGGRPVHRSAAALTAQDATALLAPGDVLIDCTGSNSLLRDHLDPAAGLV